MSKLRLAPTDYVAALGMFSYAASVAATPIILVQMSQDLSFSLAEGGGIEAVRAVFLLAILIGSGAAAARIGTQNTLAFGGILLAAGLAAYALAPSYVVVLVAIVLVGLGGGVLEALLNPLVQDAHPGDSGRYLNFVNAFFSAGVLVSVLVVGDLLTRGVSWRILLAGVGVLSLATGLLFAVMHRVGSAGAASNEAAASAAAGESPADAASTAAGEQTAGATSAAEGEVLSDRARTMWSHTAEIAKDRDFWLFSIAMFCGGGAEGAFTFWSASYIQLHFNTLARAGAIGTAVFAAGMVVGRMGSGRFVRQSGIRRLIIGSAIVGVVASLGAWAVQSVLAFYLVVFAAGLSIACFWPSIQSYAASVMDVDSTTLFILLSCFGIPGFGLTSWMMGLIAEGYGLRTSLLLIPVLLALLSVVMILSRKPLQTTHAELE